MIVEPLLGFAAGGLSILSPCVLPLAPLVLAAALEKGRWGPLALVGGLVLSFVVTGYVVAAFGFESGLDRETVRAVGGGTLVGAGIFALSQTLQDRFALALSPIVGRAADAGARMERWGVAGQAGVGALMGIVWSPCAGPTLGAAIGMAAATGSSAEAAAVLGAFGAGAATPLLAIGYGTGAVLRRRKEMIRSVGAWGKRIMGAVVTSIGVAVLTGADKAAEAALTGVMPRWLLTITTGV